MPVPVLGRARVCLRRHQEAVAEELRAPLQPPSRCESGTDGGKGRGQICDGLMDVLS